MRPLSIGLRAPCRVKRTLQQQAFAVLSRLGANLFCPAQNVTGDGAPNLLTSPEFANGLTDAPVRAGLVTLSSMSGYDNALAFGHDGSTLSHALKSYVPPSGVPHTMSVIVEMTDGLAPSWGAGGATGGTSPFAIVGNGQLPASGGSEYVVSWLSGNTYRVSWTFTPSGSVGNNGVYKYAANNNRTFKVTGYKLEQGSVATAYTPQSVLRQRGAFTDSAGTTPVTALADLFGLVLDRTSTGAFGSELFTGTYMIGSASTASYSGAEAIATLGGDLTSTGNNWLYIAAPATANRLLRIEFDAQWVSGGDLQYGSTWTKGGVITAASNGGTKRRYTVTVASAFSNLVGAVTFGASTAGSIWKIKIASVKEALGATATQPTANFKPSLTRVPKRLGPNLVGNGTFDTTIDGWTSATGPGAHAWAAGTLRRAIGGGQGGSYIDIPAIANRTYQVGGVISNLVGSGGYTMNFYSGGGFNGLGASILSGKALLVAQTNNIRPYLYTDTTRGADFDNIEVREVLEWSYAMSFGGDDFLQAPVGSVGSGETLIVGCVPRGGAGTVRAALCRRDDTAKTGMMIYADAANTWQLASGNGSSFTASPMGGASTLNVPVVLSAVGTATTSTGRLNGVASASSSPVLPIASSAAAIGIGGLSPTTYQFIGDITVEIRVPVAMQTAELLLIERWVASLQGQSL